MRVRSINEIIESNNLSGYVIDKSNESIIIYKENGNGIINITGYKIPSNYLFDLNNELSDFIDSIAQNIKIEKVNTSDGCVSTELINGGWYWKVWIYFRNEIATFITYNSPFILQDDEISEIDKIILNLQNLELFPLDL